MNIEFSFLWRLLGPLTIEVALAVAITAAMQCAIKSVLWRRALWQACLVGILLLCGLEITGVARPALLHLWAQLHPFRTNPALTENIRTAHDSSAVPTILPGTAPPVEATLNQLPLPHKHSEEGKAYPSQQAPANPFYGLSLPPPNQTRLENGRYGPISKGNNERIAELVAWTWMAGSVVLLGWMALTRLAWFIMSRKSRDHTNARLAENVRRLAARLGIRRHIRIIECERLKTPVAFGLLRPTIGLPKGFETEFDSRQQEAVLVHELAHLAAHDTAWQCFINCVAALLWWHPLVWWARRQWRLASECAADEASVILAGGPDSLAECLLRFGDRLTAVSVLGRLGVGGDGFRSSLGRRVARLLRLRGRAWRQPKHTARIFVQTLGPVLLVSVIICSTVWATPDLPNNEKFNQGDTVMKTIRTSWQRSMLAATFGAALGAAEPALVVADDQKPQPVQSEPAPTNADADGLASPVAEDTPGAQAATEAAPATESVPVLGEIPFLGRLFRSESTRVASAEDSGGTSAKPAPQGLPNALVNRYQRYGVGPPGMSPELARRYGLGLAPAAATRHVNPNGAQQPLADAPDDEEEIDATPKPFAIDPALAARYGLLRPGANADQPTGDVFGPDEPPDASARYRQIVGELAQVREDEGRLSRRYTEEHPRMQALRQRIAQLNAVKQRLEATNPELVPSPAETAQPAASPDALPAAPEEESEEAADASPRPIMDPILMKRYGLLRPGMQPPTAATVTPALKSAKGREAVRAKLEGIILEEVIYDGIPLSEVVKDLKATARERDAAKRGINILIKSSPSREAFGPGIDPTTGHALPEPVDIGAASIRMSLKDVRLIDVLDVIKKLSEVPIRYSIEDYGVVFSPAPSQPSGPLLSRTFKVDSATLTEGLKNVAGLSVDLTRRQRGDRLYASTTSQEIASLLRQFLSSAGVTIDSPNQVFYNERTGILMVRVSEQEQEIVQAAIEMLSGDAGKVMKPGTVYLPTHEKKDIIQALAEAGGFQPTANKNKIAFTRNGETTLYGFKDLVKITEESQKVWLQPGDIIEVRESVF